MFKHSMRHKGSSYNPLRHQRKLLCWAISADALLITTLVVNYFRFDWFGIVPGYAPHNFSFNVVFFIPVVFTAALIAYFVAGQVLINWRRLPKGLIKLLIILMTAPIPILFIRQIILVLR